MIVILAFDVEDIYYPPEYRVDDIPGWLAEIMTDVGVTGTFFVMGEKALTLKERGRTDVLEKMARHDIGSHQQGNRHPLIPEVIADKGWTDGVEAMRRYEDWVKEAIVDAFGKEPSSFSRHNNYFGAQHIAVAGERGLPYMYMITQLPDSLQPLWYAGALTFPWEGQDFFAGLDLLYSRDDLFEARFRELEGYLQRCAEQGREWAIVFGCHPCRVMTRGWLESYALASGMTRTPKDLGWHYDVKPPEEEERAQANFRRLCAYLKGHPDVEVLGFGEAARCFLAQPSQITRDALISYACEFVQNERPIFHPVFSPAEMVCGLAESILHHEQHGSVPEKADARRVLGPTQRPVVGPETDSVTHAELASLCQQFVAAVEADGCLPANVYTSNERIGLSQFAFLAARAYLALASYEKYEKLRVYTVPRYPDIAHELDTWVRRNIGEHWAMPLDLSCDQMAEHARLQTWTMKPAWQHPPQGRVADGPRFGARCVV